MGLGFKSYVFRAVGALGSGFRDCGGEVYDLEFRGFGFWRLGFGAFGPGLGFRVVVFRASGILGLTSRVNRKPQTRVYG